MSDKHSVNIEPGYGAAVWAIVVGILFILGEPDLLDAIIGWIQRQ